MRHEAIRRFLPSLTLLVLVVALGGVAITFLLPSQILKPESNIALALVQEGYRGMIDEAIMPFPLETTAYVAREACWTEGKVLCVYGWYAEWHGGVYLMSYTYATEADEKHGVLRGWWWEVDVAKEEVRPVWRSAALKTQYALQETEEIRNLIDASGQNPSHPTTPPLLKIP
ncbi:MAG: hypothetical protein ACE5HN_00310 [Nitrospiria bacterium]